MKKSYTAQWKKTGDLRERKYLISQTHPDYYEKRKGEIFRRAGRRPGKGGV